MPASPTRLERLSARLEQLEHTVAARGVRLEDKIDRMPGRRIFHSLVGELADIAAVADGAGPVTLQPIRFDVSQDGDFIWTHAPIVVFKTVTVATPLQRWRPVSHWPVPDQVTDEPALSMSYRLQDMGSERRFQNDLPVPSTRFSYPGQLVKLALPMIVESTDTLAIVPIIERTSGMAATNTYTIRVVLPGYKIVPKQ